MTETERRFDTAKKKCFEKYFKKLNPEQRGAVFATQGPLLVLAGAGSGKTTVLVHRIANILRFGSLCEKSPSGVTEDDAEALENALSLPRAELGEVLEGYAVDKCPPWAMMCITFTNKAANEMKSRLASTVGETAANEIWAGTFHSVCLRILRKFIEKTRYARDITIYDTDDTKKLLGAILKDLRIDEHALDPKSAARLISSAKEALVEPEDYTSVFGNDFRSKNLESVYAEYKKRMTAADAVDFDDIIFETVRLLQNDSEVLDYCTHRFRYVCVDEYQDTNRAQFVLTSLLASHHKNIMVVGDDDQSIYRFRGATIENILNFDKEYPDARVAKLEENYRSTANILGAANSIIRNNKGRHQKTLRTGKDGGEKVTVRQLAHQGAEAQYIVDKISELYRDNGMKFSDFAILYRLNAQSSALENAFVKSGIPYRILSGLRFYERKEVKDIVAYLCVIQNPSDSLRLKRIINLPKRAIGNVTVDAIESLASAEGMSMFDIMEHAHEYTALERSADKLTSFTRMIKSFSEDSATLSLGELVERVENGSGYTDMLRAAGKEEEERIENLGELVSNAVEYENSHEQASLSGFLEEAALLSDVDNYDEAADAVVMMTVHSAKGLEFPVVFLPGMEEGMFPGRQSFTDPSEIEEERRLAYVAVTRAKERLYICCARERLLYGSTAINQLSRFIGEIDDEYKEVSLFEREKESAGGYRGRTPYGTGAFGGRAPRPKVERFASEKKETPTAFVRFSPGDEVVHPTFGAGRILSAKDMSGDMLYEVMFDNVGTKKLMATYAKLEPKSDGAAPE